MHVTWSDYVALPDDDRRELVGGQLLEIDVPTHLHEHIVTMVAYFLTAWRRAGAGGNVLSSGYKIRISDRIPLRQEYYDERGELIKVMSFLDVRELGGRTIPTRWQVQPVQKPQNRTVFVLKQMQFDTPLPADVFTLKNLQQTR